MVSHLFLKVDVKIAWNLERELCLRAWACDGQVTKGDDVHPYQHVCVGQFSIVHHEHLYLYPVWQKQIDHVVVADTFPVGMANPSLPERYQVETLCNLSGDGRAHGSRIPYPLVLQSETKRVRTLNIS